MDNAAPTGSAPPTPAALSGALPEALAERARRLEWLLCDVDGVLTDGRLWYTAEGETLKAFHVRDGLAFRLAQRAGLSIGLFSGRKSPPLEKRARDLDFDTWIVGSKEKGSDFESFLERESVNAEHVAFIGDDWIDLPVIRRCGLSFCPADAVPEVRQRVDVVLDTPGGAGAVRELVEKLLYARGSWDAILGYYADR